MPIMEFISLVCIPINVAIVIWTGNPKEGRSAFVANLQDEENWQLANIYLFAILIEHVLLFIKIFIAAAIADEPEDVVLSRMKRTKIEEDAMTAITDLKYDRGAKTIKELINAYKKKKAKAQTKEDGEYYFSAA